MAWVTMSSGPCSRPALIRPACCATRRGRAIAWRSQKCNHLKTAVRSSTGNGPLTCCLSLVILMPISSDRQRLCSFLELPCPSLLRVKPCCICWILPGNRMSGLCSTLITGLVAGRAGKKQRPAIKRRLGNPTWLSATVRSLRQLAGARRRIQTRTGSWLSLISSRVLAWW